MNSGRLIKEVLGCEGATRAALYAPDAALAGCVRGYMSRSTSAPWAQLASVKHNAFPPTPTCVLVWFVRGQDTRLTETMAQASRNACALPVILGGPHPQSSVSDNNGPVQVFTVLIYPDALHRLTGLPIQPHVSRYSAFSDTFDSAWQAMAAEVLAAPDDETRVLCFERFVAPRWLALSTHHGRGESAAAEHRFDRWSSTLAREASMGNGPLPVSERQADRRIKTWTGQNLRQIRNLGRMETAVVALSAQGQTPEPRWSELADLSGFADQAHMCREFKRHLGERPGDIARGLAQESHWVYRVWA